jgi:hypothetical protein
MRLHRVFEIIGGNKKKRPATVSFVNVPAYIARRRTMKKTIKDETTRGGNSRCPNRTE